jgi:bis(5'-nucleosyl)-tetraphosphatase (symmetrical)
MATYCIGDVQGCFVELQSLLTHIQFNPKQDTLWFTGDLVNRGPQSLEVLRFIKSLDKTVVVLGNHDLHLLAIVYGCVKQKPHDTLQDILVAPDRKELCDWLRQQPLLHHDAQIGFTLVHAGLPPQWDLQKAMHCAKEVEHVLRGDNYLEFLKHLYGNEPDRWDENLTSWERLRVITNYFTRLRFCKGDGTLELATKGKLHTPPAGYLPWFKIANRQSKDLKILFGHWAALEGKTDELNVYALDTGCVWGNCLSAMRLEDGKRFSVRCSA